ncbi:Ribonuclease Y [Zhongshania aliphaticivorans]|uniref:Ribonuclease Y n=1 Tax=Zhongshania aliphaticivorans TaxID=1470434 RepID=A0A5S9P5D6_9GAMM|nr:HDOD domain-containing protein [Zhongshania aliphaticivorans]CAA0091224.1 Ribonuclease Y [Zhongshania aliphaticivorans]CAA0098674.1 Ribonuclease Y [Zhongshania aliphaticivorans]
MSNAHDLVSHTTSLISFPDVAIALNTALSKGDNSVQEVANIIERDPALTAALLRISNSASMNTGIEVTTVTRAISRLGYRQINEIVLGVEVAKSFNGLTNDLITIKDFWQHSLYCAVISKKIAKLCRGIDPGTAFTAGLLHDIGQLIIFSNLADESEEFLSKSILDFDGLSTYLCEKEVLGYDHTNVGLELAMRWDLPRALQECLYAHHEPDKISPTPDLVMVVHIANSLAVLAEIQSYTLKDAPEIDANAWLQLNIDPEKAAEILTDVKSEVEELLNVFIA